MFPFFYRPILNSGGKAICLLAAGVWFDSLAPRIFFFFLQITHARPMASYDMWAPNDQSVCIHFYDAAMPIYMTKFFTSSQLYEGSDGHIHDP